MVVTTVRTARQAINDEEHGSAEKESEHEKGDALGPLEQTDAAFEPEPLRPGPRIAREKRSGESRDDERHGETAAPSPRDVVDDERAEIGELGDAVDRRIDEGAENALFSRRAARAIRRAYRRRPTRREARLPRQAPPGRSRTRPRSSERVRVIDTPIGVTPALARRLTHGIEEPAQSVFYCRPVVHGSFWSSRNGRRSMKRPARRVNQFGSGPGCLPAARGRRGAFRAPARGPSARRAAASLRSARGAPPRSRAAPPRAAS